MAEDEPGRDSFGAEDARLTSLDKRLQTAHRDEAVRTGRARAKSNKGYSQGNRVLTEMIAGPAGGALIGGTLDWWLGTSPWILLGMLFLGFVVAFRNIMRISKERPE